MAGKVTSGFVASWALSCRGNAYIPSFCRNLQSKWEFPTVLPETSVGNLFFEDVPTRKCLNVVGYWPVKTTIKLWEGGNHFAYIRAKSEDRSFWMTRLSKRNDRLQMADRHPPAFKGPMAVCPPSQMTGHGEIWDMEALPL